MTEKKLKASDFKTELELVHFLKNSLDLTREEKQKLLNDFRAAAAK